jgi:hypothetical protein
MLLVFHEQDMGTLGGAVDGGVFQFIVLDPGGETGVDLGALS